MQFRHADARFCGHLLIITVGMELLFVSVCCTCAVKQGQACSPSEGDFTKSELQETGLKRPWPISSVLPTFTYSERAKPQITPHDAARTLCKKVAPINSLFLSVCL